MAIVGSSVVVGKVMVAKLPVFVVAGLRLALAAAILIPLVLLRERGLPAVSRRDAGLLVLQALAGIFAFNTLLLYGLTLTSAAEGGIVTSTTPAVAAALAVLLLGEPWTGRRATGVALAVLGVFVINVAAPPGGARGAWPLLGNLLVFGAVVSEGLFVVCARVLSQRLSPLVVATGITVLGLAMFLPFTLWEARRADLSALGAADWAAIAYYGVVVTVIAFLLWARGIARVPAGTAAVFTGVLPVSAVTLSYVLLGERFLWSHLLGGLCVLAGILLVAREG
jgi:drug/metabolite transporter (DMT)-like permease